MTIQSIAVEFCGRGGKRLRPRLCKAAFEAALPTTSCQLPTHARIESLCEAVECFHKASLIHDDIQDGDEERYGRPTVWKEHGLALAIAAGDWLVAHGYELIIDSGFPNALDMIKATVQSHVALCEGQGDDLLAISTPRHLNPTSPSASGRRGRRLRWRLSWARWRRGWMVRRTVDMDLTSASFFSCGMIWRMVRHRKTPLLWRRSLRRSWRRPPLPKSLVRGIADKKTVASETEEWYNSRRFREIRVMNGKFQFWWWRNFGLMTGACARIRNW